MKLLRWIANKITLNNGGNIKWFIIFWVWTASDNNIAVHEHAGLISIIISIEHQWTMMFKQRSRNDSLGPGHAQVQWLGVGHLLILRRRRRQSNFGRGRRLITLGQRCNRQCNDLEGHASVDAPGDGADGAGRRMVDGGRGSGHEQFVHFPLPALPRVNPRKYLLRVTRNLKEKEER